MTSLKGIRSFFYKKKQTINIRNIYTLFQASPIAQLVLLPDDPQFTIIAANEAYLRDTVAKDDDIMGKPLFEAFPANPSDPESGWVEKKIRTALRHVITKKEPHQMDMVRYDIPVRGTSKFREKYWTPQNHPVLNKKGDVEFIIQAPCDVTKTVLEEQKKNKARKELKREENIAESVINNLPGIFYLIDENKFYRWCKNFEEVTGYTSNEINEMNPFSLTEEDYTETLKKMKETVTQGKSYFEAPLVLKDGRKIPYHFVTAPIVLDNKSLIMGIGFDLSELERERTERLMLSEILEKSQNEIYVTDERTMRFIYVNAGARHNLGYTHEELMGMSPMDVILKDDQERIEQIVRPLKDEEKDKVVFNTIHRRADGSMYDVEVHLQLMEQDDYRLIVAIILDITDRIKIEAKVKASLEEKEVLLEEVHHRVKNNLAIVSSLLQMQANSLEDERLKSILGESEGRIQAMALIHELLYEHEDYSKIDLGAYIKKLIHQIKATYQTPGQSISIEIHTGLVFLELNKAIPCGLIINELLTNAYKHAFKGKNEGGILFNLKQEDGFITLVFSDDGIGIPEKRETGTLGLTLINGLTKQIRGNITVERNKGTTFIITFPGTA